jgi:hypothetical protein
MHLHFAFRGAGFTAALAILIFFLKIICPLQTGCLADPFILVLFSPLVLFETLHLSLSSSSEPYAILAFWTLVGFIVGFLVFVFFPKKHNSPLEQEEGRVV